MLGSQKAQGTFPTMDFDAHKVPLIGDENVGKTSIVSRFTTGGPLEAQTNTVGVSNVQVTLHCRTKELTINIWDTAGQERFRSLVPLYTRAASLIVIVFSLADIATFDHVETWYSKVKTDWKLACPIVLCGNKSDLEEQVPRARATEWANEHNCSVVFTSAVTGENIDKLFDTVGERILNISDRIAVTEHVRESESAEVKQKCC
jgi:small GTP-binding protein